MPDGYWNYLEKYFKSQMVPTKKQSCFYTAVFAFRSETLNVWNWCITRCTKKKQKGSFFFIFKVNGQALVSAVQCLPKQKGRYVLVTPAFLLLGFFIRFWKILKDFERFWNNDFRFVPSDGRYVRETGPWWYLVSLFKFQSGWKDHRLVSILLWRFAFI